MMAYVPKGRTILRVEVPRLEASAIACSTGTRDRHLAAKMERMIAELGPREAQAWDILGAVTSRRISLPTLWRWWVEDGRDLRKIRARLDDVDLATHFDAWEKDVTINASAGHAARYRAEVETLAEDGMLPRSALTTARLKTWLASRTVGQGDAARPAKSGTLRHYYNAATSFFQYCRAIGVLTHDPLESIDAPSAGAPRDRHLETAEALALVEHLAEPFKSLTALLAGAGAEVSPALTVRVADVDVENREIRIRGTKTQRKGGWRDRVCRVATWAWPFLEARLAGRKPKELLWPDIADRWAVADATKDACDALEIRDYTPRDHRHTYAVRAIKAGTPVEIVARQLGHKDGVLCLKVYGRYVPKQEERDKWEKAAAAMDEAAKEREQQSDPASGRSSGR